jgi:exosortase/archaeosortase family protein
MAFLALGVAMAWTGLPRMWQRATLIALALPTAIFVNVLRVMTLGLLSLIDSDLAAGDFHSFIGLLWLVPALMIYSGLMWILRKLVVEEEDQLIASATKASSRKAAKGAAT